MKMLVEPPVFLNIEPRSGTEARSHPLSAIRDARPSNRQFPLSNSAIRNPQSAIRNLYVAVDLGAGSGRVLLGGVAERELLLEEVRRFRYAATQRAGHLRWDIMSIFEEIRAGLRDAGRLAGDLCREICSIGVDSWGVDYGLIDAEGRLVEDPICYRDERTQTVMAEVFEIVGRDQIYASTGIQFMPFNTLFQLFAHSRASIPETARHLLLIPDLINFLLTGKAVTEYTNATTTQMVGARTGQWDLETHSALGLPSSLLAEIVPAGTELGELRPAIAEELGLECIRVVAPATHDTGSAVAGTPLERGWAYVSSGTWSLVGIEREAPLINESAESHNFTNEGGAFGTIRFLKNVMGLWILESCRKEWQERGLDVDYQKLLAQVEAASCTALIFPDEPHFLNPPSMLGAIEGHLRENAQRMPAEPPAIARMILDSLAFRYASVLQRIESLTGQEIPGVHIVGGGSQNAYLNQMTATAAGKPVLAGPTEATAIGNILIQAIAAGRFASLAEARSHIASCIELREFKPQPSRSVEDRARTYAALEEHYLNKPQGL